MTGLKNKEQVECNKKYGGEINERKFYGYGSRISKSCYE